MDNGKNSLIDVFSRERFFVVPSYQRSYSWDEKQQKDFFEDFKNDYHKINYYYGTILLQEDEEDSNKFEIVDGQQRITTLIIFIYCLLKELRKRKENDSDEIYWNDYNVDEWDDLEKKFIRYKGDYKLSLQSQENDFFHSCILNDDSDMEIETPAQKRLKNAKYNFEKCLKNSTINTLKNLVINVQKSQSLIYIIKDRKEASLIFETTNDRGKVLTNLEKVKSYLMYKVSSTKEKPDQLLSSIEATFNKVYRAYEKIEDKQLNEDSILMYNFIANENWNNEGGKKYQHYIEELKKIIEKLIDKEVKILQKEEKYNEKANKEECEEYEEMRIYIDKYLTNVKNTYDHISRILLKPVDEFNELLALEKMASFYPLLLKGYKFDTTKNKYLFKKLCRMCEIFCFRNLVILPYMSSKYQTKFYELARDFEVKNYDEMIKQYNDLYKKIATLTLALGDNEKFFNELDDNDFYNKYSTSYRNYFYWKYENWLRSADGCKYPLLSYSDLTNKDSKLKFSTEHIVAQSNEEQKEDIIKETGIIEIDNRDEFDKKYLHCIGNLTIDPKSPNSSKGNKNVEEKNSKYFSKAPYMSQNELEDFLDDRDGKKVWTIKSIQNRKERLRKFAREIWCEPIEKYYITDKEIELIKKDEFEGEAEELEISEDNNE